MNSNRLFRVIKETGASMINLNGASIRKIFKEETAESIADKFEVSLELATSLKDSFEKNSSLQNCSKIAVTIFKNKER